MPDPLPPTPAATVRAWNPAAGRLELELHEFTDSAGVETDAQAFRVGDLVDVMSPDLALCRGRARVVLVDRDGLDLAAASSLEVAPEAGDAVMLAPRRYQGATRQADPIWLVEG
jgi:hypothetical protein